MNVRRIMGVAALGAAATSLVFVPGAGAQSPETYSASSEGRALDLGLGPENLTLGSTLAEVDSTPGATAAGTGVATPLFEAGVATASVEGSGEDGATELTCEGATPAELPGLSLALACGSAFASVVDGNPSSQAAGRVGEVIVNPVAPLLETPLAEVLGPVEDGLNQLLEGLQPVTGPVSEGTGLALDDTLQELVDALFGGADLVKITIGDTASQSTVTADTVTSTCVSEGARIDVLDAPPVAGVDAPPVLSIIVGQASTAVTASRSGGDATAEVDPALVRVVSALLPGGEIAVPIGERIEIPLPEPLGMTYIAAAAGSTGTDDAGRTTAEASAVSIGLLTGEALQGGVQLDLAACASAAGVSPAQLPAAPPEEAPILPTTGSDGPNTLALASAIALAGLGLTVLRRTRTTA